VIYAGSTPLWATNTVGADADLYLTPGQSVFSPNGQFQFTLQTDGNLVEYGPYGDALFGSGTNGQPVIEAILQTDGNLVLYGPANSDGSADALWASGTAGYMGDTLHVQDDGNVVIYQGSTPLWATNTVGADANLYLIPGQSVYSPNGEFRLALEAGGNLVEYDPDGDQIWTSGTAGQPVIEAILQTDGNLVLYGPANDDGSAHPLWASGTAGYMGDTLHVQDDGNVVIYQGSTPLWATNTAGADTTFFLTPGQSVFSPDGQYQLTLLTNGDLAEYDL
jgi:hypothetical protein